jgi:hypothetical protein
MESRLEAILGFFVFGVDIEKDAEANLDFRVGLTCSMQVPSDSKKCISC